MPKMKIKPEQIDQIINFGAFSYPAKKIANILNLEEIDVQKEMDNPLSEMAALIQKGKDMADYVIDLKLFELAKAGDLKALEKFEKRKESKNKSSFL